MKKIFPLKLKIVNILKILRKPYLSLFLSGLILFVSCSPNGDIEEFNQNIDSALLKQMQNDFKFAFDSSKANRVLQKTDVDVNIDNIIANNISIINNEGLDQMLLQNGISANMLDAFEFYQNNSDKENVYDLIIENYNLTKVEDARFLITVITTYDFIEKEMSLDKNIKLSKGEMKRISWGCALAIAGTVGVSIGAIWVTGGAALIYFISVKGLATAALIEACGPGWGDI
ncbi:MAG: hypothetical protein COY55_10925 [Flavobacteriaceae bacterium CG_4_10_14_0_8_um_filter_31_99]|nr:MAG: hypothetical protein AUK46_02965 [Flavobacteriaceae bacterium CG2_30_31_66]PIV96838.1 MAG: hypothetical protein COW43_06225 [Flavobacteriaceae bacterium CG17_big_fil_post_rev_8_21_14_2_50_31_13]PIZ09858.1 MAG: hypothetical protein COY55_10925 [Flavobacteriaceae bacterium CG_4_10_14_0_8_um_filter_31_99]PJC09187.1 MAG: hypothetical protein CO067_11095 [Flavobacteriaceae bacterium CG_4_9_14_0_8_um_filter_31_91]